MKYPIGIQDFAQIIQDGYVYVDKTDSASTSHRRKELSTDSYEGTRGSGGTGSSTLKSEPIYLSP